MVLEIDFLSRLFNSNREPNISLEKSHSLANENEISDQKIAGQLIFSDTTIKTGLEGLPAGKGLKISASFLDGFLKSNILSDREKRTFKNAINETIRKIQIHQQTFLIVLLNK